MATFNDDIFPEYYAQYRGQAQNIPAENSPEWLVARKLANSTIREWANQADGTQWKELWTTLNTENPTTFDSSTTTYEIDGMQGLPGKITLIGSDGARHNFMVSEPYDALSASETAPNIYFTGSTGNGFILHIEGEMGEYDGFAIDFPYTKQPQMIEDGNSVPDMSDVDFMIQGMLARRFIQQRNGQGYNVAREAADRSLLNMKIRNNTGTYGNSSTIRDTSPGWGTRSSGRILGRG